MPQNVLELMGHQPSTIIDWSQMRKCPECHQVLPPISGVKFDKDHNVICTKCNSTVIAAVVSHERKIIIKATTTYSGYHYPNPSKNAMEYDGYGHGD